MSGETSVSVAIIDDVALETDQEFSLTVSSDEVFFERSKVSVIIQDNDGRFHQDSISGHQN